MVNTISIGGQADIIQRKRTALVKLDTDEFFVLRYIVLQGSKQGKKAI